MTTNNTSPVSKTPVSIDYTNRDFYSLRQELISRVKYQTNNAWSGSDSADFGVAILEAFAYMGDIISYYTDRVANEANLVTASQRNSIINLAQTYGYTPAGYQAASCTVLFSNSSGSTVTIPTNTEISGTVTSGDTVKQIIFHTTSPVTIGASSTGITSATHGYYVSSRNPANPDAPGDIAGEVLGTANGSPTQYFTLAKNTVVDGTVRVFVQNGSNYGEWAYVQHLADYGPNDAVFTTTANADNYVTVVFGDGVSGAIPPIYSTVKADYLVGGGVEGNISTNILTALYKVPGLTTEQLASLNSSLAVVNSTAANGGIDPDSLETIKKLAPLSFSTLQRAVTTNDYAALALRLSQVDKASATAEVGSSVTLYVAPQRTDTSTDPYPLYGSDNTTLTTEWSTILQPAVVSALSGKTQIGVSVTVSPPKYIPVTMHILYTKSPRYTVAQVESQIRSALTAYYSYSQVSFGQTVYPEDIEFLLQYIPGLLNAKVTEMYRTGETAGRKVLVGQKNEIFIFDVPNVSLTITGTNSQLSALTASTGTLSPTFSNDFYNYSLVVSTGTTSVNITPTRSDTNATVYVNGTVVAAGSSATVATTAATTAVTIHVVAQDSVTTQDYHVTITKA